MKKLSIVIASLSLALASVTANASIESAITPEFNVNDKVKIKSSGEDGIILDSHCFSHAASSMGCIYKVYVKLPDMHQGQNNHRVLIGIMDYELHPPIPKEI